MQHIWHNISQLLVYDPQSPMIFTSGVFWMLLICFMPLYALIRDRHTQMALFVVAFSLYFYYKAGGWFFGLLVATSIIDWDLSRLMVAQRTRLAKRLCLALSVISSLSVLSYFKYSNFFIENWNMIVRTNYQPLDIILPVGISFYTFQSISYIVDVYRGRLQPTARWIDYLFYLSFFPALLAGPIVRADYFIPQIRRPHRPSPAVIYSGFWLIIIGIIKKAVIADYICQYNDLVFDSPQSYSGFETLMGVVGYTMQIYCDFSGYSDIAIGLAMVMGFRLAKNFNFPFKARNLTDFWRRWHISLSTWLRDYIYIPLGGNRRGAFRTYLNNFLTMILGGLWHGAAWRFVIWGAMHGIGLIAHKVARPVLKRVPDIWPVKALSWLLTMVWISLTWPFFRAQSMTDAMTMLRNVFTDFRPQGIIPFCYVRWEWLAMVGVVILLHSLPTRWTESLSRAFVRSWWGTKLIVCLLVAQLVIVYMSQEVTPFIYFRF